MAIDVTKLNGVKGSFQPLSYEEMARPIQNRAIGMAVMSNTYENAELETADMGLTQDEYNTYLKPTMDKIRSASDSLSKYELEGSGGINEFLRIRQDYIRNVAPVKKGQQGRLTNMNRQAKIKSNSKNPNEIVFKRNAQDVPLEEFIKNPNLDLSDYFDADSIRTAVAANLVPLKKMVLNGEMPLSQLVGPDGKPLKGMYLQKAILGLPNEQFTQMLLNQDFSSQVGQTVKSIIDNTLDSYGITEANGWSKDAVNKAIQAAYSVIPQAVGETKQAVIKDENYFSNLNFQHQIATQNNQAANTQMTNYLAGNGMMKDKDGVYRDIYGLDADERYLAANGVNVYAYREAMKKAKENENSAPSSIPANNQTSSNILALKNPGKDDNVYWDNTGTYVKNSKGKWVTMTKTDDNGEYTERNDGTKRYITKEGQAKAKNNSQYGTPAQVKALFMQQANNNAAASKKVSSSSSSSSNSSIVEEPDLGFLPRSVPKGIPYGNSANNKKQITRLKGLGIEIKDNSFVGDTGIYFDKNGNIVTNYAQVKKASNGKISEKRYKEVIKALKDNDIKNSGELIQMWGLMNNPDFVINTTTYGNLHHDKEATVNSWLYTSARSDNFATYTSSRDRNGNLVMTRSKENNVKMSTKDSYYYPRYYNKGAKMFADITTSDGKTVTILAGEDEATYNGLRQQYNKAVKAQMEVLARQYYGDREGYLKAYHKLQADASADLDTRYIQTIMDLKAGSEFKKEK